MLNDICLTAYDILLRNVMNEVFAVGKYVGRASPLNYIERSGKAVRLQKHFPKGKYITHSEGMNITARKGNITHSEAMNMTS